MDPRLRTPALRGDLAAVNRALDEGADPNLADADGYNPLIFAAINGRVACAARLIKAGARIDCHTDACITPLIIAAKYGDVDMIRVLLAGGAQVDFVPLSNEYNEASPLHYAIQWDNVNLPVISVLLAAGADPTQQRKSDGYQWSPLVRAVLYAEFAEIFSLAPLLLRAGASINQPLITLMFQTLNDPVRFLRDCGPIVGNLTPRKRKVIEYLRAVHAAGGFPVYARAHRSRFAAIVSRGTRLPSDVIPTIVDYWAHPGWYKYTQ